MTVQGKAQTDPAPQPLPYTQDFSTLLHNSSTYPAGWQGHRISTGATTVFITDAPTDDLPLAANSTASTTSGGLHNYNGKPGILTASANNAALVLSISTEGRYAVAVSYALSTIRNPWYDGANTRINQATLQYRVGTNGAFTTVEGLPYATNSTAQTTAVTTPQNVVQYTHTLPFICNYQPVVQLRWVVRDSIGSGARPSIAVDDVSVEGIWFPMYTGGSGRGDASDSYTTPAPTANIFNGGSGRGDASNVFVAPPISSSIFSGGNGRGDVSNAYVTPPISASIFNGGNGRGDVSNAYVTPPLTASIFNGGNGRGDVSNAYVTPPITASIFNGGNGRGDVSNTYVTPPITASIYTGGNGRGDVSNAYVTPPLTASIFNGGNGRGDVSNAYVTPPITASIFNGGNGRGDVSSTYVTPPLTASIFNGGSGRGDVSNAYVTPPLFSSIFKGGIGRGDVMDAVVLFVPLAIAVHHPGPFICAGLPVDVPFTTTDTFAFGNTFIAQLSDEFGDFGTATTIGTINDSVGGVISVNLPLGLVGSYGRRIRVISTMPAVIGTDNGADLDVLDGTADTDGDGLLDCDDGCPYLPDLNNGQACDDGDPSTINDTVTNCNCHGCTPARFGNDQGHLTLCDAAPDFTYTCWNLTVPGEFTSAWSLSGTDLGQPNTTTITATNPGPGEHIYLLVATNTCGTDTFYLHVSVQDSIHAGPDITYTTCNATGAFAMNSLLSEDADLGGTWYNVDLGFDNGTDPVFVAFETTAGTYTYWYLFNTPECASDTAVVTVIIEDGGIWAYYDEDHDGFGAPGNMAVLCELAPGYSLNSDDCDDTDANLTVAGNSCDDGNPATMDDAMTAECTCVGTPSAVVLQLRAFLEGPFDPTTAWMHDSLRVQALVPLMEPYTAMGYTITGGDGETIDAAALNTSGPEAIVDWVVVELRDATDPTAVESVRCLLIQRDGDVMDAMLSTTLVFAAAIGDHHVAIRHRNHLGVMTATPIALGTSPTLLDLTLPATLTYGTQARKLLGPHALLWAGDVNHDQRVQYTGEGNDRDPILQAIGGTVPTSIAADVYAGEDVNMDGRVQYTGEGNDRDPILQNIGGVVPTSILQGQLP